MARFDANVRVRDVRAQCVSYIIECIDGKIHATYFLQEDKTKYYITHAMYICHVRILFLKYCAVFFYSLFGVGL